MRWDAHQNDWFASMQCPASESRSGQHLEATAKAVTIHFISYSDCTFPTQTCEDPQGTRVPFGFST